MAFPICPLGDSRVPFREGLASSAQGPCGGPVRDSARGAHPLPPIPAGAHTHCSAPLAAVPSWPPPWGLPGGAEDPASGGGREGAEAGRGRRAEGFATSSGRVVAAFLGPQEPEMRLPPGLARSSRVAGGAIRL